MQKINYKKFWMEYSKECEHKYVTTVYVIIGGNEV